MAKFLQLGSTSLQIFSALFNSNRGLQAEQVSPFLVAQLGSTHFPSVRVNPVLMHEVHFPFWPL